MSAGCCDGSTVREGGAFEVCGAVCGGVALHEGAVLREAPAFRDRAGLYDVRAFDGAAFHGRDALRDGALAAFRDGVAVVRVPSPCTGASAGRS